MKRVICVLLLLSLLLSGCQAPQRQFTATYFDLFDTVTTVIGYAPNEKTFQQNADRIYAALKEYHQLFDIYHTYSDLNNLCTLNDAQGQAVELPQELLDFLSYGKEVYTLTGGAVNICMGSVLRLWHDGRESGSLPDPDALTVAAAHTDIDALVLGDGTAQLTDEAVRLDVGALGKGYAAQKVAEQLADEGLQGYLLNVGGNVLTIGQSPEGGWVVGLEDPGNTSDLLHRIRLTGGALVTSGSYQRYFTVDGTDYHHIIDPDTLYPADFFRSVTIVAPDSALADALSTALFTMSQAEGAAILAAINGAEALWVLPDGTQIMSDGFHAHLLSEVTP